MAINYPDWLHAPTHDTFLTGLIPRVKEAYELGLAPQRERRRAEQENLANALMQMQNQYYPKIQEQQLQKGGLDIEQLQNALKFQPQQLEADLLGSQLTNEQRMLANEVSRKTGMPIAEAELYLKQQMANQYSPEVLDLERNLKRAKIAESLAKAGKAGEAGDLSKPTKSVITKNQNIVASSNNLIPLLKQLKDLPVPYQAIGELSPDEQAKYKGLTSLLIDSYLAAYDLPKTKNSIKEVENIIRRKKFESLDAYRSRIDDAIFDADARRANANKILTSNKIEVLNEQPEHKQENQQRKTFRNKKTGEVLSLTREEAKERGIKYE